MAKTSRKERMRKFRKKRGGFDKAIEKMKERG